MATMAKKSASKASKAPTTKTNVKTAKSVSKIIPEQSHDTEKVVSVTGQSAKQVLKSFFGFDKFKGMQEEIINNVLAGHDSFVIMPTGAGKSLCYQLPALMMDGVAIIVSPLIALMKNQVDHMRGFAENTSLAHFLNSSLSKAESKRVKEDITDGKTKMLFIAPETLKKDETIEFFKKLKVSFVAVDEAHCISEWGHDFRPEYRRIKEMVKQMGPEVAMMALTATATPKVQSDIQKNLQMEEATVFKSSFNRSNLYYEVRPKLNRDKIFKEIVGFIRQRPGQSGVIYCLSRKKVEELAQVLNVNGIKALPYHAGLEAAQRSKTQDAFLMQDVDVIVATIAFGMGIDKPDVRFVIHHDIPKSLEGYYQETGRAGRDGMVGDCMMFYNYSDLEKLESFMKDKPVAEKEIGGLLLFEAASFAESSTCRRKMLLHYFGEEFNADHCNKMCDNCRHPKKMDDVTDDVKKVLLTISKLDCMVNLEHIVNVVTGLRKQQVITFGHDANECFGIGKDRDEVYWKAIMRVCLLNGLITKDIESYGMMILNEKGKSWLRKPVKTLMPLDNVFERVDDEEDFVAAASSGTLDEALMTMLKDVRKQVAKTHNLPPYVIFSDPSLSDMATKYPITTDELSNIQGVGMGKAQKFGKKFLETITAYVEANDIERAQDIVVKSVVNKSAKKVTIIQNIDKKVGISDLAKANNMTKDEMIDELEQIVNSGTKLNIRYYINGLMDEAQQSEIFDYYRQSETDDLNKAADYFDGDYSREELQLMRIRFMSEMAH
jgi:ATP-dependent DNA helicase RecQ